jgi:hypothetical protein
MIDTATQSQEPAGVQLPANFYQRCVAFGKPCPRPTLRSALSTHFLVISGIVELSPQTYRDGSETSRTTCLGTARSPGPAEPSIGALSLTDDPNHASDKVAPASWKRAWDTVIATELRALGHLRAMLESATLVGRQLTALNRPGFAGCYGVGAGWVRLDGSADSPKSCRKSNVSGSVGSRFPRKGSATYRRKACSLKSAALATTSATTARGL